MVAKARSNRHGSITKYKTLSGVRWRWQVTIADEGEGFGTRSKRIGKAGYSTAAEANRALSTALVEGARNPSKFRVGATPSFGEYVSTWLDTLDVANSTIAGYQKILRNHLLPRLGEVKLDRLTPSMVRALYVDLRRNGRRDPKGFGQGLGENSMLKVHIVLGAVLAMAKEDGYVHENVVRGQKKIKAPTSKSVRAQKKELKTWSAAQLKSFLAWNKVEYQDDLYHLWRLLAFTGARRGEAIALRWEDLDLEKLQIQIRRAADPSVSKGIKQTKTYTERPIDIDDELSQELRAWKALRSRLGPDFVKPESFVFGTLNNELRTPNDVSKRFARAVTKYRLVHNDVPWMTLKGLRHTHATMLLGAGVAAKIVQERLGHSNINTTMDIYSHVTPTMQKDAVRSLMQEFHSA